MNSPADHDAQLEALLRRPAAPLPDDGFTARVMAALPPPAARFERLRRGLLVSAGAASLVTALFGFGSVAELVRDWSALAGAFAPLGAALDQPMFWLALGVAAASMIFAVIAPDFRRPRLLRLRWR